MAVALSSSSSSLNVFIVGFVLLLHVSCKAGFSAELIINRDSPKSHPASTPLSRLNSSIRRSASYAEYIRTPNPGNANSPLVSPNPGKAIARNGVYVPVTSYYSHYLVSFKIGSNKHEVFAVLDVAHDFTWLFCKPCRTCPEPVGRPIFDPSKSTNSYYKFGCKDPNCLKIKEDERNCVGEDMCHFRHKYYTDTVNGTLSKDLVTVIYVQSGTDAYLNDVIFGCTNEIKGKHFEGSMGVLGLGSGPLSLISQMAPKFEKKFSYCLPSKIGESSYLKFGKAAMRIDDVKSTTLHSSHHPFHKIKLIHIDVTLNGQVIRHDASDNIVISTSIFYTYIDDESLQFIRRKVMQHLASNSIPMTMYPGYTLCYRPTANFKMLEIELIFDNHVEFILKVDNAFVRVDNTALCLAILSNEGGDSVLGSLAQKGSFMLFNVNTKKLHFRHEVC